MTEEDFTDLAMPILAALAAALVAKGLIEEGLIA